MRKSSYTIFGSLSSLYSKLSTALILHYLGNFCRSAIHIPHNGFVYQKSWWKVHANVVTLQELKMEDRESKEVNAEKIVLLLTH